MQSDRAALAEKLLRRTLGQVGTHALVLLDPHGTIVGWLAGAERLFGWTEEEAIGKNSSMFFTPEDTAQGMCEWEQATARAHELRNPIGAISNAVELLAHGKSTAEDVEFTAGVVRRQVEFMLRMIGDLLEATRAGTGKVALRKERVVVQTLIGQAMETCQAAVDRQQQELKLSLPTVAIVLDGDPARLKQVFVNLIQNASKFTPAEGTIWVKLSMEGDDAVVRVQDTGMGISAEMMPHIFDLFTQAEETGQKEMGLGIGLAVVKETVALHGGSVQAVSDGVGKGSEFMVRLPLKGIVRSGLDGGGAAGWMLKDEGLK